MEESVIEEQLGIELISGLSCKDGRHFAELKCRDSVGSVVVIVLPVSEECDQEGCEICSKRDNCDITLPMEIEIGRKLIIRRNKK
jgi:hypothetical protein